MSAAPEPIAWEASGRLVALSVARSSARLDGFWCRGSRPRRNLLVVVHGMYSNFYHSRLKKAFFDAARTSAYDVLSFNNRGADDATATERFRDTLPDLDAALRFARAHGYRRVALAGHSTGCQKIAYFQLHRRDPLVQMLVLLAIGDDYAITRRSLGRRHAYWLRRARELVRTGRGDRRLPQLCQGFSAHRFLSIADRAALEARLFDWGGDLRHFRRLTTPVLLILAGADEYETLPPSDAIRLLGARTRAPFFRAHVIPGADHGFHGHEREVARLMFAALPRR